MRSIISSLVMVGIAFTGCTQRDNIKSQVQNVSNTENQKASDMKNLVSIVEIPTTDFSRAMNFYGKILNITIDVVDLEGIKMGIFPTSNSTTVVQLIQAENYRPSSDGAVVYLNGGDDLQTIASKIEANGGKIIIPKTEIGPEMGFYAVFTDTEGNKLGLHSMK